MKIQESGENYLETILILQKRQGAVRSIDIAHHLDFSKPSVSRAMGILKQLGYIEIDEQGMIALTELGEQKAESVLERHEILSKYLMYLGVSEGIAKQDACRIEHVISEESFEKIKIHAKNAEALTE